jgi:hypothetical protein
VDFETRVRSDILLWARLVPAWLQLFQSVRQGTEAAAEECDGQGQESEGLRQRQQPTGKPHTQGERFGLQHGIVSGDEEPLNCVKHRHHEQHNASNNPQQDGPAHRPGQERIRLAFLAMDDLPTTGEDRGKDQQMLGLSKVKNWPDRHTLSTGEAAVGRGLLLFPANLRIRVD